MEGIVSSQLLIAHLSGIKCSIHLFYIHQSVYFVILTEPDQLTKAVHNALFSPISTPVLHV